MTDGAIIKTTQQEDTLRDLIAQVARHQRRESDAKFCVRYKKFIGTTRVWKDRLLAGDFRQVDIPKRVELLRQLVSFLEGGSIPTEFYDDLPFYTRFRNGLIKLEAQQSTDRRIFCVLGGIGVGKTMACHAAFKETIGANWEGNKRYNIVIPEALRENKIGLLQAISSAIDCTPQQSGAAAYLEAIKTRLFSGHVTLIFDEAHQGGIMLMRLIKDLVNITQDTKFVYVALRTEYSRVVSSNRGAITEAKQFIRRCMLPVFDWYAEGTLATVSNGEIRPGDAALLIHHKAGLAIAESKKLALEKLSDLQMHGNLSTLSDAIDYATELADDRGNPVDYDLLSKAINEVCGKKDH